jgi:histone acetyltransferase (RNA polymerase elongator complex component)
LAQLKERGLKLLYYGLETGDDLLLRAVNKGVNAREAVEAGVRVRAAGIKLSMMVIIGLGGRDGSAAHARHTAAAISQIRPDMLSALTLMLYRGSELKEKYERGEFRILTPPELMDELAAILRMIVLPPDEHILFRSNHISNYVSLSGVLPKDAGRLISQAENASLALSQLPDYDPYNDVESF